MKLNAKIDQYFEILKQPDRKGTIEGILDQYKKHDGKGGIKTLEDVKQLRVWVGPNQVTELIINELKIGQFFSLKMPPDEMSRNFMG